VANKHNLPVGENAADFYKITKYEPPVDLSMRGQMQKQDARFHIYSGIENERNYPDVFQNDDLVIATEKIHGSNSRIGYIDNEIVIGSHRMQYINSPDILYGVPLTLHPNLKEMIIALSHEQNGIPVIYGEIYGWVQDLRYGTKKGEYLYRAFDISINGLYIDHPIFLSICEEYDIPTVPVLFRGKYNREKMYELTKGKTQCEGDNIREGIVVKPLIETTHPKLGRVILKFISDDYLTRRGGTENH
jgi:RNA ligase (TIGR02306 family)